MGKVLDRVHAVFFDVDPLLASGDPADLSHLSRALAVLKERNIPFRLLTNDSLRSNQEIASALAEKGLAVVEEVIRTPAPSVARWISEKSPRATVFLMGSDATRADLERCGLRVIDEPEEIGYLCDYIVTGAFPGFSHRALGEALKCHELKAGHVAIEREPLVPGTDALPGGGPMTAALEVMFRRKPVYVGGMPNPDWLRDLADELNEEPANCLVIGDARRSPVESARAAGMAAIVVGAAAPEQDDSGTTVEVGPGNAEFTGSPSVSTLPEYGALPSYLAKRL